MIDEPSPRPAPKRAVVLVLAGAYWPKSESAGPNISLTGLCHALSGEFDFRILARDRPFVSSVAWAQSGVWHDHEFAKIRYCEIGRAGAQNLAAILRETNYDVLWLNGFFDREFTLPALMLRRLGRVPVRATLISPRGEFGGGALGLKAIRKRIWLALTRLGLLKDVFLHATGPHEHEDIAAACSWSRGIVDAPNIRVMIDEPRHAAARETEPGGPLRLAFLGRIARVKNLDYALDILRTVSVPARFDIIGPVSDPTYWAECLPRISALPPHVCVRHLGEITNDQVPRFMGDADMLFLPTKGENFGHAIFEALACGVPVLISDQTPWRGLAAKNAGWDLPLDAPAGFAKAIESLASATPSQRDDLRQGARALAEGWVRESDSVAATRTMLQELIAADPTFVPRRLASD